MVGSYFIYLDACAIVLYLALIFSIISRKKVNTKKGKLLLSMFIVGAISALADILSINSNMGTIPVFIASGIYLASRAFTSFGFCLYFICATDNCHRFYKKPYLRLLLALPFLAILGLIISNWWTGYMYTVTDGVYERGMVITYGIMIFSAAIYMIIALVFIIIYRDFFTKGKKFAIAFIYILVAVALLIQTLKSLWLIEELASAIGFLILLDVIERSELTFDYDIGFKKYSTFKEDAYMAARTNKKSALIFVKVINDSLLGSRLTYQEECSVRRTIGEIMKATAKDFSLKGEYYYLGQGSFSAVFTNEIEENAESYAMTLRRRLNVPVKCDFGIVDLYSNVAVVYCPKDINSHETSLTFLDNFIHIPKVLDTVLDLSKVPNRIDFEINMNMASIIKRGLMYQKFDVYFQPIYSVKDKAFTRAEALLRLMDDKYGEIKPEQFLSEAERNGSIHKIGDIVFDKVCSFIASNEFKKSGLEKIEINLSVSQCANEDLPIHIMDCVKRYNVSPSRINLEITETSDAYSRKMMEDNIKVLKELGFSFSLDDYGNGYSSMDNVSSMPVDTIKLDRTLTNNDNPDMKVMFEHSIKMIKDLKKKIVIEGVENEDILKHFESDLCDYIQGFYFSKPLPKEDLIKFLFVKKGIIKEGEELPKENEEMNDEAAN
ncbi:EAL domain-containing protein (putative c-di-GMP-specific phosphodiesterase class I) [Anaeroplasma bactoclasticum]|jgi:EAL domain-containing protein (putative c-di-GMP-specific phosphodiesterase class I)|uniref:EAL domain-containing protein (Putative c-di-GMP-specific phosphodiesterase class I) n=1 Tax=Anaeroplasma bactoclasticum TaxID=2088 RepID=A0A397RNA6_9MOLU|nr:EAL domain-containing protein [Anaeroplasma bactoclasticum]RIA75820.1 EAL domain-containing protein (putative c-di-GMP-specific phosphodiesterase class I) [Anaeroplasma bactoclasticum]